MKTTSIALAGLAAGALATACTGFEELPGDGDVKGELAPLDIDGSDASAVLSTGVIESGTVIPDTAPNTLLRAGELHGYTFNGQAGGVVTLTQTGVNCGGPDTLLRLFGPKDAQGQRGAALAENDDRTDGQGCVLDSRIAGFRLPATGKYLIVAGSYKERGGGTYGLTVSCDNGACTPADAMTFARSRVEQAQIDSGQFTVRELFDVGNFLFRLNFSPDQGLGNGLAGLPGGPNPRPNMRQVHRGGFGGPDSSNCFTCHNVGGDDGGGDADSAIFQAGDGVNPESALKRNPPSAAGLGYRQQIGIEMSAELQRLLAEGQQTAAATGQAVTVPMVAKGISFGQVIAHPPGAPDPNPDFSGLEGVDADLVVKPFGVKGRDPSMRRFAEGGFRVHFGMAPETTIAKHCANPNPDVLGTGPNCEDPDQDGVEREILEGQLTATAVYLALLDAPVRVDPANPSQRQLAARGETVFGQIGCANCHVPALRIDNPVHQEFPDLTGAAPLLLDLRTDSKLPRPEIDEDGGMIVEAFSDYKRHDMGPELADHKPFNGIPASHFITPALWGVGGTPPYLHDGRAEDLVEAIELHGGEGAQARDAYAALSPLDQKAVEAFLLTLGRAPGEVPDGSHIVVTAPDTPINIPDNNPAGITSSLQVAPEVTIGMLQVRVDIAHTFIGDLRVELRGPGGFSAILHNRSGGVADDIHQTFGVPGAVGLPAAGTWELHVSDLASADVGVLQSWAVDITPGRDRNTLSRAADDTPIAIPDDDAAGITSSISVVEDLNIVAMRARVSIQHSFIGDLRVVLLGPDGTEVTLHNRTGGANDNIEQTFDVPDFVGDSTAGTWSLRVSDEDGAITGTLLGWTLFFDH